MSFLLLPIEVWTIIIRKLDTQSVCALYETCRYFRSLICMNGVVQECNFSLSALATAKSLNLDLFIDVAQYLKVLNLSCVSDLNKSSLMPVLNNLKSLIDLDVSFTKINMPDYLEIAKILPTLKNLAINFSFGVNYKIDKNLLKKFQETFAVLKNVHFVGSSRDLLNDKLVLCILQKADLFNLKYTLCHVLRNFIIYDYYHTHERGMENNNMTMPKMTQFQMVFLRDEFDHPLRNTYIFKLLDLNKYEIVMFQFCFKNTVFATPLLQKFIRENFDICVDNFSNSVNMIGKAVFMFWDKESQFDKKFYSNLMTILREYLVYSFDCSDMQKVPANYNWHQVEQYAPGPRGYDDDSYDSFDSDSYKRLRRSTFALNYDDAFKEKENIKLKISFLPITRPVTLRNCEFLKKLTHLFLSGSVQYSSTFFKKLFECCDHLVTLVVTRRRGIVATPLQFLSKCKSLKNILLYVRGSHLSAIFSHLSECRTLENIHLADTNRPNLLDYFEPLPDPRSLFSNCDRLYNFCIQSYLFEQERNEILEDYKEVRDDLGRYGLNIDMFPYSDDIESLRMDDRYLPYLNVFDVFSLV